MKNKLERNKLYLEVIMNIIMKIDLEVNDSFYPEYKEFIKSYRTFKDNINNTIKDLEHEEAKLTEDTFGL